MKNKINLLLVLIFISIIVIASDGGKDEVDVIGCTELNGDGCVCHSLDRDTNVVVWVEGPDTLAVGETGLYKMFLTGGPAEGGGYNVAGRFGTMELVDTFSFRHLLALNELGQAFPLAFPSTSDTIYWEFGYTASDSSMTDTIYSCGLSLVYDSIPDNRDRWNYGPRFPITVLPVTNVLPGNESLIKSFSLEQNYPNPFNPATKIKYIIAPLNLHKGETSVGTSFLSASGGMKFVKLKVYDVLGNEVATLVNEEKSAGNYEAEFRGENLPSGIYFYTLEAGDFVQTKKMILLK